MYATVLPLIIGTCCESAKIITAIITIFGIKIEQYCTLFLTICPGDEFEWIQMLCVGALRVGI